MRAAFVIADVLRTDPAGAAILKTLDESGLRPVVLQPRPAHDMPRLDTGGFPLISCGDDDPECWGDEPRLILEAVRRSGATPSEAFLVCAELADVERAADAGCRPVLVLAGRTLDEVYGPGEPGHKAAACAPDLETAGRFMMREQAQHEAVGPFPYGAISTIEERARTSAPSQRDVVRVLATVVGAGLAVALGFAYLLQEVYESFTFPSQAYWLTLQFIPQAARGALFLAIGAALLAMALRILGRWPFRGSAP